MLILLSPAKLLDVSRKLPITESSIPEFTTEAALLVSKLRKLKEKDLEKMMHLSRELAELNVQRFRSWESSTVLNSKTAHAIAAFNGEVYRGLDALTMTHDDIRFAQNHLRILSGLYGVLRPLDLIQAYRLEMGVAWGPTGAKNNLYKFWGTKIAEALNRQDSTVIVNLASAEYFKAVDKKKIKGEIITPVFKEFKNGKYQVVMVYAKQARGSMARYIIENRIESPELLKEFDAEGYRFDANLSVGNEWVFTR